MRSFISLPVPPRLRSLACYALLTWLSLAEWRLFDRLLFRRRVDLDFVLINVAGVLNGTPISKSWQQRFFAPACVALLDLATGSRRFSLALFGAFMVLAANLLLFHLLRRKQLDHVASLAAVAAFGLAHLVLTYKLEYPWDGVDILLFMGFGYWASRSGARLEPVARSFVSFGALCVIGALNHETVLYLPLWCLLAALPVLRTSSQPATEPAQSRRLLIAAALSALGLVAVILVLRDHYYLGPPKNLARALVERAIPGGNHLHIAHNLQQLFVQNFADGHEFISVGFLAAVALLCFVVVTGVHRVSALWSLCVLGTIIAFGYVNETRHYLVLVAFWFTYAVTARARFDSVAHS